MTTKKFPIAIQRKVDAINSMLPQIELLDNLVYTYAGTTYPYLIDIKPIVIKNQFVTIESNEGVSTMFIEKKERYNVNKVSMFGDDYCSKHLNYTLNIILKEFKKALK